MLNKINVQTVMSSILISTERASSSSCIFTSLYSSSFSSEMSPNSKLNFLLRALLAVARRVDAGASRRAFCFRPELDCLPPLGSKSRVSGELCVGV
jgi:hypothetical protein